MFGQSRLPASALALLASLMIASQVEAGCSKDSICQAKNYEQFANDLYKLTGSIKSEANLRAHKGLKSHRKLLLALEDIDREEQFCESNRLKSLRSLAEAMAANGNLGPEKLTEPIRRLNALIIKQIAMAEDVCYTHLASKWPHFWQVTEDWDHVYKKLFELDSLPRPLLLESEPNLEAKELVAQRTHRSFTCFLYDGEKETDSVLRPYVDLLIAANIIKPESNKLARFYEGAGELAINHPVRHPNKEVLDNAYRLRACQLLANVH